MYTNGDRLADARDAALDRREAALTIREVRLAHRMAAVETILAAGDRRDVLSDARDVAAEMRERHLDRVQVLAGRNDSTYSDNLSKRRDAALARGLAKDDRLASHDDRVALTDALA